MFSNRSRLQIIYDILATIKQYNPGAPLAHIIHKSNLNSSILKIYLDYLMENDLIRPKTMGKKTVYDITDKGKEFLRTYRNMVAVLDASPISKRIRLSYPSQYAQSL